MGVCRPSVQMWGERGNGGFWVGLHKVSDSAGVS